MHQRRMRVQPDWNGTGLPGRECPVCEGTPYAGKQFAVGELVETISEKDWNQCSREEIEEFRERIENYP